jgi:hypothetical protein
MSETERTVLYNISFMVCFVPFFPAILRGFGIDLRKKRERLPDKQRRSIRLRSGIAAVGGTAVWWSNGASNAPTSESWIVVAGIGALTGLIGGAVMLFIADRWGKGLVQWYSAQRHRHSQDDHAA